MSNPRAYLERSLTRLADRGTLIRRDVEMRVEGVEAKSRFLEALHERIQRHRAEDQAQLADARREIWGQWDERLKRLEGWIGSGAALGEPSRRVGAWRTSVLWFGHAVDIGRRYSASLEPKAARLEQRFSRLRDTVPQWLDRLLLKESELRGFLERETAKGMDVLISSARKRPLLDFVYAEREEEARLAREFAFLRGSVNRTLERLIRAETWTSQKTLVNPGYFETHKNSVLDTWDPIQKRILQIRENTLNLALSFEEGRRRLRWIYDTVQQLRVVHETPPRRRPLLERLFKIDEN